MLDNGSIVDSGFEMPILDWESRDNHTERVCTYLREKMSIEPSNKDIETVFCNAFTTTAYAKFYGTEDYSRLSFHGDHVLPCLISRELLKSDRELTKGELSVLKTYFVSSSVIPPLLYSSRYENVGLIRFGPSLANQGNKAVPELFKAIVESFKAMLGAMDLYGYDFEMNTLVVNIFRKEMNECIHFLDENNGWKNPGALSETTEVRKRIYLEHLEENLLDSIYPMDE